MKRLVALASVTLALAAPGVAGAQDAPTVALTFDDGPTRGTAKLLRVLDRYDVLATFYVKGRCVKANPGIARRIVRKGHALGNHSWNHPDLTRLSAERVREEFAKTQQIVREVTGVRMANWRPPYGQTNDLVRSIASEFGLTEQMWTVSPADRSTGEAMAADLLAHVHPGAVVLFHEARPVDVEAITLAIPELQARGYEFVVQP